MMRSYRIIMILFLGFTMSENAVAGSSNTVEAGRTVIPEYDQTAHTWFLCMTSGWTDVLALARATTNEQFLATWEHRIPMDPTSVTDLFTRAGVALSGNDSAIWHPAIGKLVLTAPVLQLEMMARLIHRDLSNPSSIAMVEEAPREWGPVTNEQALSILTTKTNYVIGERIILHVALKNTGKDDELLVGPIIEGVLPLIEVITPNKAKAPLTLYSKKVIGDLREHSGFGNRLRAGERLNHNVDLSRCFDLTLAGQYTVSVAYWVTARDKKSLTKAFSNIITITIDSSPRSDPCLLE